MHASAREVYREKATFFCYVDGFDRTQYIRAVSAGFHTPQSYVKYKKFMFLRIVVE